VIGLTGGIASGKSAVAAMLRERGAAVIDADLLAREVVEPGQPALAELRARFGDEVIGPDGRLDRKALGARVFADPGARAALEGITHPRIAARTQEEIARWADRGAKVVFYEAALLVENQAYRWLDGLVVVSAPPEVQLARVMARDGLDEPAARARIASQLPLARKLEHATWVIDNAGTRADAAAQLDAVVAAIEAAHGPIAVPSAPPPLVTAPLPTLRERVLVTGFPAFTARRMIGRMLAADPSAHVHVLARDRFADDAAAMLRALPGGDRADVVVGDVCDLHLGLASTEYRALAGSLTTIHHLAGIYYMGVDADTARRVNVAGTRGVIELADDCSRLRRLVHWSTVQVSGKRRGWVAEDELDAEPGFHNVYEQTKHEAERLARAAMRRLPITVLRTGIIVGDSRTGEIDKFDGPYYLVVMIATNASSVHLPLPGRGDAPLHLVPIDYVVAAAHALATDPRAAGRTFHVTDPNPLSARRVLELVASRSNTATPRGFIPGRLVRNLLRLPGLERPARSPRSFLQSFDHDVAYDTRNTQALLEGTGIVCPPFESYAAALVAYVRDAHAARGAAPGAPPDDTADALD
jgi:dephospho-CoA kinase